MRNWLKAEIQREYDENHQVYVKYGASCYMGRYTVALLMTVMGLAGVLWGKKVRTTVSRKAVAACNRVSVRSRTPEPAVGG